MRLAANRPVRWLLLSALTGLLVLFAACSDDDDDDDGDEPTDEKAAIDVSKVPELEDGTLLVGSDIAYPPIEFFEEGTDTPTGLDVELMTAMGEVMGVEVEFTQVADFAGIIGDLNSERYDIVMSAISITPEREAEIAMIPYFGPAGTGILVQADNPQAIESIEDLCGKAVGAQVGTVQIDYMNDFNGDMCADNPIEVKEYPDNPASVEDLKLGRIAAQLSDDPVAAYAALQSDDLVEVTVTGFDSAPYGIGVRNDSGALRGVLEEALALIQKNGIYDEILTTWGLEGLGIQ